MLLIELAAQGVKGVAPAGGAARLRPGYNVLAVEGTPLRQLCESLFFPASSDRGHFGSSAAPGGASVRAGLTVVGDDGATYRVLRDFAAGCQLLKFDPQKRAFAAVSQDPEQIEAFLKGTAGVPTRDRLRVLSISSADLPSRRSVLGAGAHSLGAPARPVMSGEQAVKRLAELRSELERSKKVEKLQYQLDDLQSRLFKTEEALKEGARAREALEAAQSALASADRVAAVAQTIGDVDAKLNEYGRSVAKRDEALSRLTTEREAVASVAVQGAPLGFWLNPFFWLGIGGGLAAIVAAVSGSGSIPGLRYIALLDIPAFGWAAWVALRWVNDVERQGRILRRSKLIEEHEKKVEASFERETAAVRAAIKSLGLGTVAELQEAVNKLSDLRAAVESASGRATALESKPETRSLLAAKADIEEELRKVEGALGAEAGGYVRDPRSVEIEIQQVEEGASLSQQSDGSMGDSLLEPIAPPEDPMVEFLKLGSQELGESPAGLVRSISERASQTIQALSANRLGGIGVDDRGNVSVQVGGRPAAMASLPLADRDLAFLVLKIALIERALAGGRFIAFSDDAFSGLPETARRAAGRILKQLARPAQLIHATTDIAFRESADQLV